jgi:hypothetical protein
MGSCAVSRPIRPDLPSSVPENDPAPLALQLLGLQVLTPELLTRNC